MKLNITSLRGSIELLDEDVVNIETENNGYVRKYRVNGNGIIINLNKGKKKKRG